MSCILHDLTWVFSGVRNCGVNYLAITCAVKSPFLTITSSPNALTMSGLEVAGVVLAAFPLIISGLEHWRSAVKSIATFVHDREEITMCKQDLSYEHSMYKANLRLLLLPVTAEAKVEELIRDPGGTAWQDHDLQARLKLRLGDLYQPYMDSVYVIHRTLESILKELTIDKFTAQQQVVTNIQGQSGTSSSSAQRPPRRIREGFHYQLSRIRFSIGKPERSELFAELEAFNRRLAQLISTSDQISAIQTLALTTSRRIGALKLSLRTAWQKSDLLFKAIQDAWCCGCRDNHLASLRLEHRDNCVLDLRFELVLMYIAPQYHLPNTHWGWQEMVCGPTHMCNISQAQASSSTTAPLPITTASTVTSGVAGAGIALQSFPAASVNLCRSLSQHNSGDCVGTINQDNDCFHLHRLRHVTPSTSESWTLAEILTTDLKDKFYRRQRISVALLLASAVAQLCFTPWLRNNLTKNDVIFQSDGPVDPYGPAPFGKAYIRKGFDANSASATPAKYNFFSLGIILLELGFGKAFEDSDCRQILPNSTDATIQQKIDQVAADAWSKGVACDNGPSYAKAVDWCLNRSGSSNMIWRGDFIEKVIQPLEHCSEHLEGLQ